MTHRSRNLPSAVVTITTALPALFPVIVTVSPFGYMVMISEFIFDQISSLFVACIGKVEAANTMFCPVFIFNLCFPYEHR